MAEKVTFASCEASFHKIMGEIKGRKFAPIYLLQGEEFYFIDALCDALTEGIMDETMRAFNQITVYGADGRVYELPVLAKEAAADQLLNLVLEAYRSKKALS